MSQFDVIVKGGRVATAADVMHCDIGIKDGRVTALAESLGGTDRVIDASGSTVAPGGVDGHCHLDQPSLDGSVCADDFTSGTRSAAAGGTTTVISFALQMRNREFSRRNREFG
jgi:dihydropyrimidinase